MRLLRVIASSCLALSSYRVTISQALSRQLLHNIDLVLRLIFMVVGCLQGASSGPPAAGEAPAASQEVTALQRTAAKAPACDVVISYHADDIALMRFIQGTIYYVRLCMHLHVFV